VLPPDGVGAILKKEGQLFQQQEKDIKRLQIAVRAAKAQKDESGYKQAVQGLRQAYNVAFTEMAAVRKELAIAKIPFVIEYVESMVEEGEKVVVMAHHREVVDKLQNHFGLKAVKLYGGMSEVEKSNNVDRFQTDPSCMVFIGSISAAGVGITLTAAQKMLFAELDWTPANMLQAEDRIHRIGQTGNALIQQLVFDGSLDAKMAETLVRKMGIIEKALDKMSGDELDEPIEIE
jgi:SNF2 family DNA or RNA helicase